MTELELFKQAIREACKENGYTWMLSGPADQMRAHCSHCGGAAPKDETGKTKLTALCPHCGEEMFHKEKKSRWRPSRSLAN